MGIDIAVTGARGMLGRAVCAELAARDIPHKAVDRQWCDIGDQWHHGWNWLTTSGLRPDLIINCAGITRGRNLPFREYVRVNSFGPHNLADYCGRLLQVSTDCVFDGFPENGPYLENILAMPDDIYGVSKLAGEVTYGPHLTVRTSFIGYSPTKRGLLDWFLSQPEGATVDGWTAMWGGYYVAHLAQRLVSLALDSSITGLAHLPGAHCSKLDLLQHLGHRLRPDITIVPTQRAEDMRMKTERTDTADILGTYTVQEMIDGICSDFSRYTGRPLPE